MDLVKAYTVLKKWELQKLVVNRFTEDLAGLKAGRPRSKDDAFFDLEAYDINKDIEGTKKSLAFAKRKLESIQGAAEEMGIDAEYVVTAVESHIRTFKAFEQYGIWKRKVEHRNAYQYLIYHTDAVENIDNLDPEQAFDTLEDAIAYIRDLYDWQKDSDYENRLNKLKAALA